MLLHLPLSKLNKTVAFGREQPRIYLTKSNPSYAKKTTGVCLY